MRTHTQVQVANLKRRPYDIPIPVPWFHVVMLVELNQLLNEVFKVDYFFVPTLMLCVLDELVHH